MTIDFKHRQTAHCESGVVANLLTHNGLPLSEPMAFGLGQGLFFGYFPFIRLNYLPLTTFRVPAGFIIKKATKALGVSLSAKKYRDPATAMAELDQMLDQSIPVGVQASVYWLSYIPKAFRFHFNGHNLVVYGRKGDEYLISDPVMPFPTTCSREDLARARFAKGPLAPKGKMYYFESAKSGGIANDIVRQAVHGTAKSMVKSPFPLIGVKGVRFLAGRLLKWPQKLTNEDLLMHLSQIIRMQEEIGTGGGGFRFLYSAYLQECAEQLADDRFADFAEQLTASGDRWRDFAVIAARICKGRAREEDTFPAMAEILRDCADIEEKMFAEMYEYTK